MRRPGDMLPIGRIAKRTGMAVSAIRYYETEGLVHPIRTAAGQRQFRRSDIRRLSFVKIAQELGFSLSEIREEMAKLPEVHNPIADMIPMEDDKFLVVHDYSYSSGKISGQVFNGSGECIGNFDFPGMGVWDPFATRLKFSKGYAYAMERNEDGDNIMARYTYKLTR